MDIHARAFVDRLGVQAEADGLPPIAGRLFGTLLLSGEPRSLDELAAELGVSKASVSTDCRRLLERGIVERVSRHGDRRDFYQLAPDFFVQLIRQGCRRWTALNALAGEARDEAPGCAPAVRERLAHMDAFHGFVCTRIEDALHDWGEHVRRERAAARSAAADA